MCIFIGGVQPRTRRIDPQPRICPGCGLRQAYVTRIDTYLGLFFIPLVPIKRGYAFIRCDGCGRDYRPETDRTDIQTKRSANRCPTCGADTQADHAFCPFCGSRLS